MIYYADSKNYPYGTKSIEKIKKITSNTISQLKNKFNSDLIVIGLNTFSLTLNKNIRNVVKVLPPIDNAIKLNKLEKIEILTTQSIVNSNLIENYAISKKLNPKKLLKLIHLI